jgi:16S rRNA (guanine966-N2)-methyltransferase
LTIQHSTSLRITAGSLRGRRLPVPLRDVRPTSERARQAYFNIVSDRIRGARFVDLFAGSGAFAFEAASRGAGSVIAVDSSRANIAAIEKHATEWDVQVKSVVADALKYRPDHEIDLVYADPPYDFTRYDDLLAAVDRYDLNDGAMVAIEHRRGETPFTVETQHLVQERRAEYGEVWITFFGRNR